jgi:hypothetical protein
MSEANFWEQLRLRINQESVSRDFPLLGWCDWFEPKRYQFGGDSPCITGRVGFVGNNKVAQLDFVLFLPSAVASLDEIEWETLLPGLDAAGWLSVSPLENRLEIRAFPISD